MALCAAALLCVTSLAVFQSTKIEGAGLDQMPVLEPESPANTNSPDKSDTSEAAIESEAPGAADSRLSEEERKNLMDALEQAANEFSQSSVSGNRMFLHEDSPELKFSYTGEGSFRYELPNGSGFELSAPLGSITSEAVKITAFGGAWIEEFTLEGASILPKEEDSDNRVSDALYKEAMGESTNGESGGSLRGGGNNDDTEDRAGNAVREALRSLEQAENEKEGIIEASAEEPGRYAFKVRCESRTGSRQEIYEYYGGYRIVKEDTPIRTDILFPPYGYAFDGTEGDYLELTRDGKYEITFILKAGGAGGMGGEAAAPEWKSIFIRDTAPPSIVFSPDITKIPLNEPLEEKVNFSILDRDAAGGGGAELHIYRNGNEILAPSNQVAASGSYRFVVSDALGNGREYSFRIENKGRIPPWFYFGVPLLLLGLLAGAFLTSKSSMRIL